MDKVLLIVKYLNHILNVKVYGEANLWVLSHIDEPLNFQYAPKNTYAQKNIYTFQEFQKPKSTDFRKQLYRLQMLAKQASCNVHTYSYICTKIIINCSLFVYNLITVLAGGTGRGSMVRF